MDEGPEPYRGPRHGCSLIADFRDNAEPCGSFAGGGCRDTRGRFGLDVDLDVHPEFILRIAPIRTRQGDRLIRRPRDTHPDEIAVADDAVGRIELDPSRARHIDLAPGV